MSHRSALNTLLVLLLVALLAPAGQAAEELEITVEDHGQEPRRQLRYNVQAGDTQRIRMAMRMRMQQRMAQFAMPETRIPEIMTTFQVTVDEVEDDVIHYSGRYVEVEVAQDANVEAFLRDMLVQQMELLREARFKAQMTTRGVFISAEFDVEDAGEVGQMLRSFEQSFDQMSIPLPEEAIGQGARWRAETTPTMDGLTFDQTTTTELVSLDGDNLTLRTTVRMLAEDQALDAPGAPAGALHVEKFESEGVIEADMGLGRIMPVKARGETDTTIDMRIDSPQGRQQMEQTMHVEVDMDQVGE